MEKSKFSVETLFVIIAGFGTLLLVYFAYVGRSSGGAGEVGALGGTTVLSYPIITTAPVDEIGLANAQVALASAELEAQSAGWNSMLSFFGLLDTNKSNVQISDIQANAQINIAHTVSDAEKYISEQEASAIRFTAEQNARALIEQSRYQYETTRQQEKSKRTSTVGDVFKNLFKLF